MRLDKSVKTGHSIIVANSVNGLAGQIVATIINGKVVRKLKDCKEIYEGTDQEIFEAFKNGQPTRVEEYKITFQVYTEHGSGPVTEKLDTLEQAIAATPFEENHFEYVEDEQAYYSNDGSYAIFTYRR